MSRLSPLHSSVVLFPLVLACGEVKVAVDTGPDEEEIIDGSATDSGAPADTSGEDTDTEDSGSTDTGSTDTGSTDTGSTDTGSTDTGNKPVEDGTFFPTNLFVGFEGAIEGAAEGAATPAAVMLDGVAVAPVLTLYLVDSAAWSGPDDTDNACYLHYDMSGAEAVASDSALLGSTWGGWTLDASSMLLSTEGRCDELSSLTWGTDVSVTMATYTWALGLGAISDGMSSDLSYVYGETWPDTQPLVLGGYVQTDFVDGLAVYELDYGFGYAVSSGVVDQDAEGAKTALEFDGATELWDAYYVLYPAVGWSI